jgi:hypothetical protein
MVNRIFGFLTSLRLTVVCLALALVLVFVGTLAEVRMGLYQAQTEIFRSFIVYWSPEGSHVKIPVFPGGWLIGMTLLVNLIAAHIKRFKFAWNKAGILLTHAGLIFLLLGQFITEREQVESTMRLAPGTPMNYTEDSRKDELAIIDTSGANEDVVTAIPASMLVKGGEIHAPGLPFTLRVKDFVPNAFPAGPMSGQGEKIKATQGLGQRLWFTGVPETRRMDDENKPTALIEIVGEKGTLGDWTVSTWISKPFWRDRLEQFIGGTGLPLNQPQTFSYNGHNYQLALRPVRYYKPYTVTLLEFKHDIYAGTDIPSNFSSKIHLNDPSRGENRDVLIYMNNPLRYRGETFYQASFEPGDKVSILQVVRNPASITPYVACTLVGVGLTVQFLMHLFGFARKRVQKIKKTSAVPTHKNQAAALRPAMAGAKRANI